VTVQGPPTLLTIGGGVGGGGGCGGGGWGGVCGVG